MGSSTFVVFEDCFALLAGEPVSAGGLLLFLDLRGFSALVGLAQLIFWLPFFSQFRVVGGQKYDQRKRQADAKRTSRVYDKSSA